jgi:hypothetical protein
MANTTFNPADKNVGITLSGSNLIATNNNNALSGVRAVDFHATGKYYWEITFTTPTYVHTGAGFTSATNPLNVTLLSSTIGTPILGVEQSGAVLGGVASGPALGAVTAGTAVCFAVDCGVALLWVRRGAAGSWNASGTADPATGIGGFSFSTLALGRGVPLYPWCLVGNTNDRLTANFGDSAFTGVVPAGFTPGFTSGGDVVVGGAQARVMVLA